MHGTIDKRKGGSVRAVRRSSPARTRAKLDEPVLLKITPRLNRGLERLAAKSGKPKTYHVRRALERYIEDTWDVLAADEALRSSRKTYSAAEVKKHLGLAN
jgi:RHH-type rel operon transcriptional repressor/antitoxin RelB